MNVPPAMLTLSAIVTVLTAVSVPVLTWKPLPALPFVAVLPEKVETPLSVVVPPAPLTKTPPPFVRAVLPLMLTPVKVTVPPVCVEERPPPLPLLFAASLAVLLLRLPPVIVSVPPLPVT